MNTLVQLEREVLRQSREWARGELGKQMGTKVSSWGPLPAPPFNPVGEFSLVIMMDGWMARERGPDWGASRRRKKTERIAWHEIKSAVIYRLEQAVTTGKGRGLLLEK